jgi:hypothetical protein
VVEDISESFCFLKKMFFKLMNKQEKIEFKENTEHQFKAILIVYTGADQ